MVAKRALPERRNPLLEPTESTAIEILVERRRLGQTQLAVKPGTAGVTSATKAENLGTFDYTHLRVPLPKDLSGSGIFSLNLKTAYPESYFLMRRSADGYVSATGMFKAAFPWATLREEEAERMYQKTFPSAGPDEVAGSVWIAPEEALALAEEYSMRHWIEALLDPAPIEKRNKEKHNGTIQGPPKFDVKNATPAVLPPPVRSTRGRSTRSASPSKMATPSRKIATPRKARTTRNAVKSDESLETATPGSVLQNHIANGATPSDSAASSVNGDVKEDEVKEGTFRVEIQETTETNGNVETTTTNVKLDVPHSHSELPEPEDPMKMIEEAKRMVAEAQLLEAGSSEGVIKVSKRRIEEVVDAAELAEERSSKAAKVAYTTEQKLTKEKVTRRALVGLGVMAAIGTAFGYLV
ncbi:apses transcription factor-like protein [Plenodomus tracheiphilus IPT5]|uniref:Apses transcription factor-like protein n=1 Tax=Plenodomus tracheiphilus IPT5 TaxID=1408161 RepID=A0A6A7BMV3_9PLEO|nr:apses transcription factor-like protein [Plenodomus tracheiphilus IPT5]